MSSPISSVSTANNSEEIESSPSSSYVPSPTPKKLLNIVKDKLRPWHQEEGISPAETARREIAAFRITEALWNRQKAVDVSELRVSLPDLGEIKKYLPAIRNNDLEISIRDENHVPQLSAPKESSLLTRRRKFLLRSTINSTLFLRRAALRNS